MNEQYLLHLNNFKTHLEQLEICKTKVDDRCAKAIKLMNQYNDYILPIQQKALNIFEDFKKNIMEISLPKLNEYSTKITFLREENNFFINNFDVLSSGENELKKNLKAETSKINYLVEAALKLKFFIADRFVKICEKYADENHDELTKIKNKAIELTDEMNIKTSLINTQISFVFSNEMETSSKLQSLEAMIGELSKRFSSIG